MLNKKVVLDKSLNPKNLKLPKFLAAKKQLTLSSNISFSGIGLHSGKKVNMIILPAPADTGFMFRIKRPNTTNSYKCIPALYKNVKSTQLCTLLSDLHGNTVSTVEHVLSALYGLEVDNVYIDLDSTEIPVYDGSSSDFVNSILEVGLEEQQSFKKMIKILKKVEVKNGVKVARVSPSDETIISSEINYDHPCIGKQSISILLNPQIYRTQISTARTFGFLEDVKKMRSAGLALGGSLDNAIVLDNSKVLNSEGLRFEDEFVRHKVLDFIGDISLSGHRIIGSFFTSHSGHAINVKLVEEIFKNPDNWEMICSN